MQIGKGKLGMMVSEGVIPQAGLIRRPYCGVITVTLLSLAPGIDLGIFQNSAWLSLANAGSNQQC